MVVISTVRACCPSPVYRVFDPAAIAFLIFKYQTKERPRLVATYSALQLNYGGSQSATRTEGTPSLARSTDLDAIPIVLGVARHIDFDPEFREWIRENLHRLFEDFRTRYPVTERVLLSPLAAGADQLVADVAVECGFQVVVPLPFPAEHYPKSSAFKGDPTASERMLEYVRRSYVTSFVVPLLRTTFARRISKTVGAYGRHLPTGESGTAIGHR